MKKNILCLIAILAMFQGIFAMETTAEQEFQARVDSIKQLIGQNKLDEALANFKNLETQAMRGFFSGAFVANRLFDLENYLHDAQLKYEQVQLKDIQELANQHKYTEAYNVINEFKKVKRADATRLEIQIKQQEAAWKKAQEPVIPVEEKWIFIKEIAGAEPIKKTDWQIQGQNLLLNLDATDIITSESFENLIQQAQKDNLPFILVMVQSGDATKFFPYFFAADVMKKFMQDWKKDSKFINPINREQVTNIDMYVMGDDKTLHLLKDKADVGYLEKLVDYKGYTDDPDTGRRTHNYELKPELTKPGIAKTFINNLYKEEGKPALFNL